MMLSLAAGITVSISGNKLLFKNADGIEIGSKTLSDDDLKIVEQTIEGENYSNLTEVVSAKEAEVYLHFLESGSTEGMTESELKAVQKIEELIKSNKIDYDGILKIRNETVKSDVEVVRNTTEDSVEDVGKSAAEDAGKVVETSYGKSIENTEFFKENGGLDASDYISIHSRKHMYDPDTVSTPKKTQYGKDVNVGKLCEDTIMKPDEVIYNKDQNVMIYKKEYPFNISTSDTPTGTHRVFIPLNTQGKKTIRMSQFPLVGGN